MRRVSLLAALALVVAGCGSNLYESPGFAAADTGGNVVLWRLAAGPAGFVGIGGPVAAADLDEGAGPLLVGPYASADGTTWETGEPFGSIGTPAFGLAAWDGGYAAAGAWDGTPAAFLSSDGLVWRRVELPGTGEVQSEVEAAGIAARDGTVVVTGYDPSGDRAVVWLIGPDGTANTTTGTVFPAGSHLRQVAAGPAGFVAAASSGDELTAPPPIWVSDDGVSWDPVLDPFDGAATVSGLIGTADGYVAVVADPGGGDDFTLWTSEDGIAWVERADQDSAFTLLHGTGGLLLADLTAPPGEPTEHRSIAFSFNGRWAEITEIHDGRRFVAVSVAATAAARVISGFTGTDAPIAVVLVAEG